MAKNTKKGVEPEGAVKKTKPKAKPKVEPKVEQESPGVTLGSLRVGRKFTIPAAVAEGATGSTYIKYGTVNGIVAVEQVGSDVGDIFRYPEETIVEAV